MSISTSQQASFYQVRPFMGMNYQVSFENHNNFEDKIRKKIAEGDQSYARNQYAISLDIYLEAYGMIHRFLHPDFPVFIAKQKPQILLKEDVFKSILESTVNVAQYREFARKDLINLQKTSRRVQNIVNKFHLSPLPIRSQSEINYESACVLLQYGALDTAEKMLNSTMNARGKRSAKLRANALSTLGVISVLRGETQQADRMLKKARSQFKRLKMPAAEASVLNNAGVLFTINEDGEKAGKAFSEANGLMPKSLGRTIHQKLNPGLADTMVRPMGKEGLSLLVPTLKGDYMEVASTRAIPVTGTEEIRVYSNSGTKVISLADNSAIHLTEKLYQPRLLANDLHQLQPHLEFRHNFIAYIPYVYGFLLPLNIGDCYMAIGYRTKAVEYYLKVLSYPYLNQAIESPMVWLRLARAIVAEADHLFRQEDVQTAKDWYEEVLNSDDSIPSNTRLYQDAVFSPMRTINETIISAMNDNIAFGGNYEISALVAYVRAQLAKINAGLNWLGIAPDVIPIWSFNFLQQNARYFAQHAIQAWREYISFRSAAEQSEMSERELEQAVTMSWYALQGQQAQKDLAEKQLGVVQALRDGAILHRDNLEDTRDQFNTAGWVIAELNRFQAWYGNAQVDINYDNVHWDWGGGFELGISAGGHQDRVDQIIRYRNRLSHDMQIDNFNRQIAEANAQINVANRQIEVAQAQINVARWQTWSAERQYDFARENLAFFRDREFTSDLYHALADRLKEIANRYLEMGIYAAFLMERAFNVENDREIRRIRFDYAYMEGVGQLTSGDSLLLDVDSFTHDLLVHVKGRRNRLRHVISLADFAPQAFTQFLQTGHMDFTIPLDVIERVYPGTYLHRIQSVEIEIEGLQVPQGISGTLTHKGISSWRRGDQTIQSRITAPESMVLSGFQLRRDLALYRADPNRLELFENSGTAASWHLHLPIDINDINFGNISDVRIVFYFYALHDQTLEATIRASFPTNGEAAQSFSARLHAPDKYFAFGPDPGSNMIDFDLTDSVFPYNQTNLMTTTVGVQVLRHDANGLAQPFENVDLTVRMAGQIGSGTTDANGLIASDDAATSLSSLVNQPIGNVEVEFTNAAMDRSQVADVFLLINYQFDYRS